MLAAVAVRFRRLCAVAFDERVQVGGLVLLVAHGSSLINDAIESRGGRRRREYGLPQIARRRG